MKEQLKKVITKDGIKLPYPNPVSYHQQSKNVGYAMGWRAAIKSLQQAGGEVYIECKENECTHHIRKINPVITEIKPILAKQVTIPKPEITEEKCIGCGSDLIDTQNGKVCKYCVDPSY